MRGKAVTQFMWSQSSTQTQLDTVVMQNLPDADAAEALAVSPQKDHLLVRSHGSGLNEYRARFRQILLYRRNRLTADGNQAFLVPFSDTANATHTQIQIRQAKIQQFGDPQ